MLDFKETAVKLPNTISSNSARNELSVLVEKIWGSPLISVAGNATK
ncbi:MAG: hypothetical protein J6T55_04620 [Alphaproteobacteria bacterium]|nr:hypothetical protein [Alphaproteobacteria bacterium]